MRILAAIVLTLSLVGCGEPEFQGKNLRQHMSEAADPSNSFELRGRAVEMSWILIHRHGYEVTEEMQQVFDAYDRESKGDATAKP